MVPVFDTVEELHAWSKANPTTYCCHEGVGRLVFDPLQGTKHFDPWWMLLVIDDEGILDYYSYWLKRVGEHVHKTKLWGTHVSVIKHEEPPDKALWGRDWGDVSFHYAHTVRRDNGRHAWVDVYSPELSSIRQSLGLPAKEWFHLTIGRLW